MFFRDYVKNTITYDAAQFAIAIALDNLNDVDAAKSVLSFLCPSMAVGKQDSNRILLERKELAEKVASGRKGVVWTTIDYYYNNPVFKVRSNRSRTISSERRCSLRDLTRSSQRAIYEETMRMLIKHPVNHLIYLYTKTTMFTKEFINFVKRDGTRNSRSGSGAVSDSVARELATEFSQFVLENCAEGSYHPDTCTPNAFLFAKKATDGKAELRPIDWFKFDQDGRYFKILNRTGTNITVGEDLTLLDQVSIDLGKKEYNISFILTCEKISKASALLFTHLDKVYFDILSYHRKVAAEDLEKYFSSLNLVGCKLSYGYDLSAICEDKENLVSKFNSRCGVCKRFEQVLNNGIQVRNLNDLYSELITYSKNICAGPSGTKDAKSLFSFSGYHSREPGTNGTKFLTLLEGYMALKDLINFLQSDSNTRDVGVADFPCDIFRQPLLLKRFKSYEDYIDYIDEIRPLVDEVAADNIRSASFANGLYSNDYVYDVLETSQLIKPDVTLQAIADSPLNSIQNAVDLFENAGKDKEFIQKITDFYQYWDNCLLCFSQVSSALGLSRPSDLFDISKMREINPIALLKQSIVLCQWILSIRVKELSVARTELLNYFFIAALSVCLRAISFQCSDEPDVAITDGGEYLLKDVGLLKSLVIPDSIADSMNSKVVTQILVLRARAIKTAMFFLWGDDEKYYPAENDLDSDWVEVRNFWFVTTKIARYIVMNNKVLTTIYSDTDDLALMKVETVRSMPLIKLPVEQTTPTRISAFAVLKTPFDSECSLPFVSRKEAKFLQESLSFAFCGAFKNLFSSLKLMRKVYANLIARSTSTFNKISDFSGAGSELDQKLSKASQSVLQVVMSGGARPAMEQKLAAIAEFDELGFAKSRYRRFVYSDNVYIHQKGYAVELSIGELFDVVEVTEDMLFRLQSSLL